jgi:hypothetical protein
MTTKMQSARARAVNEPIPGANWAESIGLPEVLTAWYVWGLPDHTHSLIRALVYTTASPRGFPQQVCIATERGNAYVCYALRP